MLKNHINAQVIQSTVLFVHYDFSALNILISITIVHYNKCESFVANVCSLRLIFSSHSFLFIP